MGGKVHVYRRENSRFWQCSTYLAGKSRRATSRQESLSLAKEFAEGWYLNLRGKARSGEITNEKAFRDAAARDYAQSKELASVACLKPMSLRRARRGSPCSKTILLHQRCPVSDWRICITRAKASRVCWLTWCSMPSVSASAVCESTPMAIRNSRISR